MKAIGELHRVTCRAGVLAFGVTQLDCQSSFPILDAATLRSLRHEASSKNVRGAHKSMIHPDIMSFGEMGSFVSAQREWRSAPRIFELNEELKATTNPKTRREYWKSLAAESFVESARLANVAGSSSQQLERYFVMNSRRRQKHRFEKQRIQAMCVLPDKRPVSPGFGLHFLSESESISTSTEQKRVQL